MSDEREHRTHTQLLLGKDARNKLYVGLDIAAQAVECTLGPKGKTVVISRQDGPPVITKDGVTVIKSVKLKDPAERIGADILKQAASHTNETAGDGTTTSTVLTHSLVREGLALLDHHSARDVCRTFESLTRDVVSLLHKNATPVASVNDAADVATISANNDKTIGKIIADAIESVGSTGIVTVEDAKSLETSLTFVEGMQIERGYVSPYFVNSDEKMKVSYRNAYVLVTDKKIASMKDIVPVLEGVHKSGASLLIIAEDIEGEALQALILNKINNNLKVVAIKSPGYGTHKVDLLDDICTFTGAKLVSSTTGVNLKDANLSHLGRVKTLVVDSRSTLLVSNPDMKLAIDEKLASLRALLKDVTLPKQTLEQLQARVAKLGGKAAVINVGGATDVEIVEKKYRIEDALNATRAAVVEGILPGGGVALLHASRCLPDMDDAIRKAFIKALQEPIRKIAANAGVSPDVVINELKKKSSGFTRVGWNAATDEYVDMVDAGIVDPTKVTRTALENAASVAVTFLSMDAAIVEHND